MSVCGCEGCGGNCTKELELELQNKQKENEEMFKELEWLMNTFGIFGSDLERIKHIKKRYGMK